MSTPGEPEPVLPLLVGYELSSVVFVRDYCQLVLEQAYVGSVVFSCFVWPRLDGRTTTLTAESAGYRDALCSLIDQRVVVAAEAPGRGLGLGFADGSTIVLDPDAEEVVGPEIAMVQGLPDDQWMVWRPGDGAFAHLG